MIRRGDDDAINVFVVQQPSKFLGCSGRFVLGFLEVGLTLSRMA